MPTPLPANVRLEPLPPEDAIRFFQEKQLLTPSFSWQDVYQDEHRYQFAVAKMLRTDLLRTVADGIARALARGETLRDFTRELTPYLQREGWWGQQKMTDPATGEKRMVQLGSPQRLATIFEVNTRIAYAAGHYARATRAGMPYFRYSTMRDDRVRPLHRRWHGLVLPVDHPFWQTRYPPNGWRCRCSVYGVSDRGVRRLKADGQPVITEPPPDEWTEFTNRRTGEVSRVPFGVDPGFAYNFGLGAPRRAAQQSVQAEKLGALAGVAAPVAAAEVRELVASPAFASFYAAPSGTFPVGVLRAESAKRIGSDSVVALLSSDTATKQRLAHPELGPEEYRYVQESFERGREIQDGKRSLVYLLEAESIVSVVKATRTGKALYLTSLRKLSSDQAKRDREVRRLLQKEVRDEQ